MDLKVYMPTRKTKKPLISSLDLLSAIDRTQRKLLALDYDGTLAPFRKRRMEARPLPGIIEAIGRLAKLNETAVAIISGRPLIELLALLGEPEITMVGSHGFEIRRPNGDFLIKTPSPVQIEGLEKAEQNTLRLGFGKMLEKKVASIAFHTRGLRADKASALILQIEKIWSQIAAGHGLRCSRFNGGIELCSTEWNKGDVVLLLIEEWQPALSVYIGDNTTDEDVFRVLSGRGVGIKVGNPESSTAAQGFLPDCESVKAFLEAWLSIETGKG